MKNDVTCSIIINKIIQDKFTAVVDFYLQPVFDLSSFQCVGAEVLMRGVHRHHIVSPGLFLPQLGSSESIIHIGQHIIREAFQFLHEKILPLKPDFFLCINMATHQLNAPGCAEHIIQLQTQLQIPASALIFEITASEEALDDTGKHNIAALQDAGLGIAWDDVATTENVMENMTSVASDYIKLDRSCLNPNKKESTSAVISLIQNHQVSIIAEGVETMAQTSMLLKHNVKLAQGFLFSRPIKKMEFINSFLTAR
ncbi:EAL domain-containing protein [Enterobacteriaceae bacterium RIT714]|jgi:EAL domain-containing protein (putative c-di-GMP-specific phosphodiesterase class I)|uniref:EAL domain-containing protein n=1 Tax=Lelliottia sp. CFBP8978 TaxID=3096522 RepID=UPI0012AC9D47|nr:EAL domain-containing protein [Lelliottia sp. CFBP8978]MDY1038693.1 EAL domain-containing protein [Lelliottia sp. CFBP8978]MRS89709.1 EAL domain-containing protein [Enterobacteriaceae bacterium RIT714]